MAATLKPQKVKLITGLIFQEQAALNQARLALKNKFGEIDFESPLIDFHHTDYYEKELGSPLKRKFLSFRRLISPEELAEIKSATNTMEKRLSLKGKRTVNIDPGYISLAKLVLASAKDFSHRVYLGKGIYAEITLLYFKKNFQDLPWTYPDYRSIEYKEALNQIRGLYAKQIKKTSD